MATDKLSAGTSSGVGPPPAVVEMAYGCASRPAPLTTHIAAQRAAVLLLALQKRKRKTTQAFTPSRGRNSRPNHTLLRRHMVIGVFSTPSFWAANGADRRVDAGSFHCGEASAGRRGNKPYMFAT